MINIRILEFALQKSWSEKTCFPSDKKKWTSENPAVGQCAITSMIVHDNLGGELLYCKHNNHYWNRLPNGEEIDLTRSQFSGDTSLCIDAVIKRKHLLSKKKIRTYDTYIRYRLLKNRIKGVIKQLKKSGEMLILNEENRFLYLISSNASFEYIIDILETLALPYGSIQHFRYQLRWLDDEIRKILPKRGAKRRNGIKNIKVIICYLYQEKKETRWEWQAIYPIRIGTLVNGYKTGETDEDIAHLYFQVENYFIFDRTDFKDLMRNISNSKWEKKYSYFARPLDTQYIALRENSISAFHKICECLDQKHFESPDLPRNIYYPLFCYVEGISKRGKIINPSYDSSAFKSYYRLRESATYYFEYMTYSPYSQKVPKATIEISSDTKFFTTPSENKIEITSRYNAESMPITSIILEKNLWSYILFKTNIAKDSIDDRLPLNLNIIFPLKIKRMLALRCIDAFGDLGFGIGTGSLAFKAALSTWTWWYWPTLIGYTIWAISKMIIKLWKG